MTRSLNLKPIFTLALFALASLSYAGTIQGTVYNERSPQGDVKVFAESDLGVVYVAQTCKNGSYTMDVPNGFYTVTIENPEGLEITEPDCGFYYEYIEGTVDLPFHSRGGGVVIDFGDPVVGGGGDGLRYSGETYAKAATSSTSTFDFSIYMAGLSSLAPDTIEISGYWYIPGTGPFNTYAIAGWPGNAYAGAPMEANYVNLGGGGMIFTMACTTDFTNDGEIATYRLTLSQAAQAALNAAKGKLAFCGDSVRMFRRGELVYDNGTTWNGHRSDLGPISGVFH